MASYELGISTSMFRPFTPEKDLAALAERGVKLTELSTNCFDILRDKDGMRDLKGALARTGIHVHSIHVPFPGELDISSPDPSVRRNGIDATLFCLDRLVQFGGRYLVQHPNSGLVEDDEAEERSRFCVESLRILSEHMAGSPFPKIAVETMIPKHLCNTSARLIELLDAVGSSHMGVCLDVNHANLSEDLIEATTRYGRRILTLHISDNDGVVERHWVPGRGVIPWRAWVKALLSTGYSGPLMLEIGKPKEGEEDVPVSTRVAQACRSAEEFLLAPTRDSAKR